MRISFITTRAAAEILGCDPRALAQDRRKTAPSIPYFKVGKIVRYQSAVIAYIADCKASGKVPTFHAMSKAEARRRWPTEWRSRLVAKVRNHYIFYI